MPVMHRHSAETDTDRPYSGPIYSARPNRRAHGGITRVEQCACGATRSININNSHRETGSWS